MTSPQPWNTGKSPPGQSDFFSLWSDFIAAAKRWRLWTAFAIEDIRSTYRRSAFGVLWVSLSFLIFVGVKIIIFGSFFSGTDGDYYALYLVIGFFVWQFIYQVLNSAPFVFISNEGWLRNDNIELPVFALQGVTRSTFDLLLTAIVVLITLFYFRPEAGYFFVLIIPAVLLLLVNALWVNVLLGLVAARFRDISHLTSAGMRVMFFLTPIFWLPEQLPERVRDILWFNPFSHFIWIARAPVLDNEPATASWIFVGCVTLIGWAITMCVYAYSRKRLIFWL